MIRINETIPDLGFEIFQNNKFSKKKFSDYGGKWLILLFYPADFTFVCPTELEQAAENHSKFTKIGAEVLSISTDTVFVHKAWHDNSPAIKKINFPMVGDPSGLISKTFGTYIEEEGLSLRATLIIDPEGKLKAVDMHDNSIGRSIEEILRKLQASIYVAEHKGEVCPVNWKPGVKTLKPGPDLVGKI